MRIYVASSMKNCDAVQKLQTALQDMGYEITHDWTRYDNEKLTGPIAEKLHYLMKSAKADLEGIEEADAFVLLNHPECRAAYTELGYAIAKGIPIEIIGAKIDDNVFFHLPWTAWHDSTEQFLKIWRQRAEIQNGRDPRRG